MGDDDGQNGGSELLSSMLERLSPKVLYSTLYSKGGEKKPARAVVTHVFLAATRWYGGQPIGNDAILSHWQRLGQTLLDEHARPS